MGTPRTVKVQCLFARAGFSHERKFLIAAPAGGFFTGTAYIGYCFQTDGVTRLRDEEPPEGQRLDGLLVARLLRHENGLATIAVPDGEVCDVSEILIEDRANVPVES